MHGTNNQTGYNGRACGGPFAQPEQAVSELLDDLSDANALARHPKTARVTITLKDAPKSSRFLRRGLWHAGRPPGDQDFLQKFGVCLKFAILKSVVTGINKAAILSVAHDLLKQISLARTPDSLQQVGLTNPQS